MEYFEKYASASIGGSGNQLYFSTNGEVKTGKAFYRISVSGKYNYSLLFSNITDSTYSDGKISCKNLECKEWKIYNAYISRCKKENFNYLSEDIPNMTDTEIKGITTEDKRAITFNGNKEKTVKPGEFFSSDATGIFFEKGDYLCLEITFSGDMIPYHEESLLPLFSEEKGIFRYSKQMPVPGMIGCSRAVKKRIAFLGDSITQGIGTPINSYKYWNSLLSEKLSEDYSFWNLGIGYGRANDGASDGSWLYKAKQNDIVFVCFGVNDILQGQSEEQIKEDLTSIVDILKKENIKVILQTIPPFDYVGEDIEKWKRINNYIKNTLDKKVDLLFDNTIYLGKSEAEIHKSKYGGHPDINVCKVWSDEFYKCIKESNIL